MAVLNSLVYILLSMTCIHGDLLSNLDKMDIESKLRELGKVFNSIDNDEANVIDNILKTSKHGDDEEIEELSLGSAVEMLSEVFGGECTYQCKNGNKPTPRIGHRPTSNGCGSYGVEIDTTDLPGMTECCNTHDHCYDTCNAERSKCDSQFKDCLHNTCKMSKNKSDKTTASYKDCKSAADILYGGSVTLGCNPYLNAQETACTCIKPSSAKKSTSTDGSINSDNAQNKKYTDALNEQRRDKTTVKSHRKHGDEL